jgi:hypothetical protein
LRTAGVNAYKLHHYIRTVNEHGQPVRMSVPRGAAEFNKIADCPGTGSTSTEGDAT